MTNEPKRAAMDYVASLTDDEVEAFLAEARHGKSSVQQGRHLFRSTHRRTVTK